MSVGSLMASRLARGLFHKAIPQSGAGHHALTPATASATAARFAELTGGLCQISGQRDRRSVAIQ